jgi:hypothetical protein
MTVKTARPQVTEGFTGLDVCGAGAASAGRPDEGGEEHDDPEGQQGQQAFMTTPTMPGTIAAITSSKKRAINPVLRFVRLLSGGPAAAHR